MYAALQRTVDAISTDHTDLASDREQLLRSIAQWIGIQLRSDRPVHLVFICTHNSRRSQLAQVWAATAASSQDLPVKCWSAGTEVTEVAQPVIDALEHAGFRIDGAGGSGDLQGFPRQNEFIVNWDDKIEPVVLYSKSLDDKDNPADGFAAIMVCSDADVNCPFVPGADQRFSLPYRDPKTADGSDQEERIYRQRSEEIAHEMFRLMELVEK